MRWIAAVLGSALFLTAALVAIDPTTLPEWARFGGRLHPALLHVPIGALWVGAALEAVRLFRRRDPAGLDAACTTVWALGWCATLPTVAAGALLATEGGYDHDALDLHRWLGVGAGVALSWLWASRRPLWVDGGRGASALWGALLIGTLALVSTAGHWGGVLTHGSGFLERYDPFAPPIDARQLDPAADAGLFATRIQPVLDERCVSCHGPEKTKGGLRLDSHAAIMAGGAHGPVVIAGNALASPLYTATLLPEDADQHMPPAGKAQLTAAEIEALGAWIASGAEDGDADPVDAAATAPVADADAEIAARTLAPREAARADALLARYHDRVAPLLEAHCASCHGPDKQKGEVRLDTLDPDMLRGFDAEGWRAARDMIYGGEMPPPEEPQLGDADRRAVAEWLDEALAAAAEVSRGEVQTVLRRLTKAQYTNTLQELLGVPVAWGQVLPDDGKSKLGFSNDGEVLQASPLHLEYYQEVAREAVSKALALGPPLEVARYRVSFGKGIGKGLVAGRTGGYQSVPLSPEDFTVAILDAEGNERAPADAAQAKALDGIRRRISVGLRGSSQDRFRIVDEGMMLFSALPHREVVPKSWQGPSPNLKLEMQRVFPEDGDFALRVHASRGYLPTTLDQILVEMEAPLATTTWDAERGVSTAPDSRVFAAVDSKNRKNVRLEGELVHAVDVPKEANAQFPLELDRGGFYQIDLVHPAVPAAEMPSVRLSLARRTLDLRPSAPDVEPVPERMVTTLGAAVLRAGRHNLQVGGKFFVGFSHVVVTPLPAEHPLVARLTEETENKMAALAQKTPALRALIGTRTDDGMDYATFGEPQEVLAPFGRAETYTFVGRLENLPIPEPESGDTEVLSGFMLLGVWNDHLVKSARETGPPLLVEWMEFEAPLLPQWPPASRGRLLPPRDDDVSEEGYAREVLERFLGRAFRRPATSTDVERYLAFWRASRGDHGSGLGFEEAMRETMIAALCSPNFLYLAEPAPEAPPHGAIDQHALASRLAYFLWNSPPDAALRELADRGALRDQLLSEVDRMVEDPRLWRFVRTFTREWLRLDRLEGMSIDVRQFPDFTRFVKRDMAEETYHFVHHLIRADRSLFELVDSDYAMLNQNLAEFYGIEGVAGPDFRPVDVAPELGRGGLLAQGSFLTGHSDGRAPHPIKRAVWLSSRILGIEPSPPPPNVPDLDPETPGFDKLTLKEQLEVHRDNPSCMDCHSRLDPYGIVFERYNAVGRIQPERKGRPVDASATLPDGTRLEGVGQLKRWLLGERRPAVARALIRHLYAYALGRDVHFGDQATLDEIEHQVTLSGFRMRSVLRAVIASAPFSQNP